MLKKFWCSRVFRDVPGVFRGVPGCSGVFRGCSGGVPGVFRAVPGLTDTHSNQEATMLLTKQRSNGARARHELVKEIVMYVIGINVLQCKII